MSVVGVDVFSVTSLCVNTIKILGSFAELLHFI